VDRRNPEQRQRQHVDAAPQLVRQVFAGQRRELHRQQQVETDDAERHPQRVPRRRERHEHVGQPEVHVAIEHDRADVDDGEDGGETPEEAVQVEHPRRSQLRRPQLRRQDEAPHHRRAEQRPGDDSGSAGAVPEHIVRHRSWIPSAAAAINITEDPPVG